MSFPAWCHVPSKESQSGPMLLLGGGGVLSRGVSVHEGSLSGRLSCRETPLR